MDKNNFTKEIDSENLFLRKFKLDDYKDMFGNWASDQEVANMSGFPKHRNEEDTKTVIKIWLDEYNEENIFNWAIVEKISSQVIGSITVVNKDIKNRTCEIGYNIGKDFWKKGYGSQAVSLVLDYLFETKLFDVITANCLKGNIASKRVLEKNGFVQEGLLRHRTVINDKFHDKYMFSLLRSEYEILKKNRDLISNHKWLKITTEVEDYIEPEYYNRLLKHYIFNGKTDLDIFRDYLLNISNCSEILELGCGSGRVSDVFVKNASKKYNYDLLDLSHQMLDYTKDKFSKFNFNYIESDTIDYLLNNTKKYDFVFSLWSYSHSVHQQMHKYGVSSGNSYVEAALRKFIISDLLPNGKMFIIHFDSLSEEQEILMKQWKKFYPTFSDTSKQSPSLIVTDSVLSKLQSENIIDYKITHLTGEEIGYDSLEEAMEIFLNFHMESYANEKFELSSVYRDVEEYIKKFKKNDKIYIKPGCFIIEIKKR